MLSAISGECPTITKFHASIRITDLLSGQKIFALSQHLEASSTKACVIMDKNPFIEQCQQTTVCM
jgi:hypothetical protein